MIFVEYLALEIWTKKKIPKNCKKVPLGHVLDQNPLFPIDLPRPLGAGIFSQFLPDQNSIHIKSIFGMELRCCLRVFRDILP